MSYRAGIGPVFARVMGAEPDGPKITCDGCGLVNRIPTDRLPPKWFMDNKAAPGWSMRRSFDSDGLTRLDLCPRCKEGKG